MRKGIAFSALACCFIGLAVLFSVSVGDVEETPTYQGNKARISVGEIKTEASACSHDMSSAIGEMLSTALANSDKFIVLTAGEEASGLAELQVSGAVTTFEPEADGGGLKKKAFGKIGIQTKTAEIVMDVKLIQTSTGRILKAKSIEAKSTKWGADMTGGSWVKDVALAGALSVYSNEPMEKAIRAALAQTVDMVSEEVPDEFYRYTGQEQLAQESAGTPAEGEEKAAAGEVAEDMALYTKYDFVPGDKVIFYDDMKEDEEGEFPYRWNLDHGVYEVVRLGKEFWIMCTDKGTIRPKIQDAPLPPRYTVEMEIYSNGADKNGHYFFILWIDSDGREIAEFNLRNSRETYLSILGKSKADKSLPEKLAKGVHVMRIMATSRSMKCFINNVRVANVPQVENFHPVGFKIATDPWIEDNNPLLFRGFRFAEGGKSMREQLDETGKIVTHGILFDVNSAKIKGESYKTLKDIGQLLQDDAELNLSIEGHTDSDGSDEHNMTLSQSRANSVQDYLISTYNIDSSRLEAKGWGESKPIDTNDSPEGKANNRRVELVKL